MRFNEFYPGQVIHLGPRRIEEAEIIAFASTYDPQWFHTDPKRATEGRWGGLIASGWHTCAIAMRMVCDGPLLTSESIGSPGLAYLKWLAPVRPNDELRLEITILEARIASSKPFGIVKWQWQVFNQERVEVLELEATSLFQVDRETVRKQAPDNK